MDRGFKQTMLGSIWNKNYNNEEEDNFKELKTIKLMKLNKFR